MPELPEVETIRLQLEKHIVGQTISSIEIRNPKKVRGNLFQLQKQKIISARRFSKLLILDFDNKISVAIHLKMTGKLIFNNPEFERHRHTHLLFSFISGDTLSFNDYRRFGTIDLIETSQVWSLKYIQTLGKEFFVDMTPDFFYQAIQSSTRAIKQVLLDQSKMAGVGNIYANESLWRAKIHPEIPAKNISQKQSTILFTHLEDVMKEALSRGGATSENYLDLLGNEGTAQHYFDVYNQEGNPCNHCGTPIQKYPLGGRGTYFCPTCQKKDMVLSK